MKVTPDTNFFISAFNFLKSFSNKLLIEMIEKDVEIYTSIKIIEEFKEVMEREFLSDKEVIKDILEIINSFVNIVEIKEEIYLIEQDSDDNKIIECAVSSNSDFIITYDPHLLNIKEYRGIKIIKPEELILN